MQVLLLPFSSILAPNEASASVEGLGGSSVERLPSDFPPRIFNEAVLLRSSPHPQIIVWRLKHNVVVVVAFFLSFGMIFDGHV